MTVLEVKQMVRGREGVPVEHQRLIFGGKMMEDNRRLEDYNVKRGSSLHLVLRLRGSQKKGSSSGSKESKVVAAGDEEFEYETLSASQMQMYDVSYDAGICSIEAGASAMLQIASERMFGERVHHYDPKDDEVNVMASVHLTNDTGMVLAPGDMSIFDEGGRFVGQVDFAPMLPNDDQLIAYSVGSAVDATRVKPNFEPANDEVTNMEMATNPNCSGGEVGSKNCVSISYRSKLTTSYKLVNTSGGKAAPKVYVDHTASLLHDGYTITAATVGGAVKTATKTATGFARYVFALGVGEEVTFEVCEEAEYTETLSSLEELVKLQKKLKKEKGDAASSPFYRSLGKLIEHMVMIKNLTHVCLLNYTTDQFNQFSKTFESPKLKAIVSTLTSLHKARSDLDESHRKQSKQGAIIANIMEVQMRLRDNIKGLEKVAGTTPATANLLSRYVKDLSTQEDEHKLATDSIADVKERIYVTVKEIEGVEERVKGLAGEERKRMLEEGWPVEEVEDC